MSAVAGNSTLIDASVQSERLARRRARVVRERTIELVLFLAALVSVFTTVGIVYILVKESVVFFTEVPITKFLTDTQWTPLFDDAHFGIMVLLSGTLTSSAVALAIAIPLGPGARGGEALPRAPRRRADHRLRLLRAALRDAVATEDLSRPARVQPALGRHRHGHHDHSLRELDLGGRDARGADEPARGLLRDGSDALPDRDQGGGAGGVLGHRLGVQSRAPWARP